MSNVLVLYRNFVSTDLLTSQNESSEIAAAPATNVYDKIRRTKVWRSGGYFLITAANKSLIFQETDGVDLTATLTEDEYTSDASFLAAIKAALEAAGASTYTVTRDTTTRKIKITSDGLGGGGIFSLIWTDADSTIADTLGFSAAADDTGALTYTADSLRIHTSEWLRWDLGTSTDIQGFAMCGTRKDGLRISSTATVTLQGNETDVWTAPTYSQALTYNPETMALVDLEGLHTTGLRYWRLEIVDRDNPLGYIELSNVFLGEAVDLEQGAVQFPLPARVVDFSKIDRADEGNKFATVRQVTVEYNLEWKFLSVADKEILQEFAEEYRTAYPFWISLDPESVYSSTFQKLTFPCTFEDMPDFTLERPGQFGSGWKIREAV